MRYVAIGAPHTSNWDFVTFLAVVSRLGLPAKYLGKDTLFRWPFGGLMRRLGGIPVRRDRGEQTVAGVVEELAGVDRMALVIAPEGTRRAAPFWRSGFYRIAEAARLPIVLGFVDYSRKVAGVGPTLYPTGDVGADMAKIRAFYADKVGRVPEGQGPVRLREEVDADPDQAAERGRD